MTTQLDLFEPVPEERSGALFDEDNRYRYRLWRRWGQGGDVCFVMLNPSTANARQDDPTIRRCAGYAKRWGYGGLVVVNLFALRATDPRDLCGHEDPVGPENDRHLLAAAGAAGQVVCAWGVMGSYQGRGGEVASLLRSAGATLHALEILKGGQPGHPLYLRSDLVPRAWEAV